MMSFILASASPRRKELLQQAQLQFTVVPSTIDETMDPTLSPGSLVQSLALQKANDVFSQFPQSIIVGADTIVVSGTTLLGKPQDKQEAKQMLQSLSGTVHDVYTGVAIVSPDRHSQFHVKTTVEFWELTEADIEAYIASNEPFDKAGAYGIQGIGATLVKKIDGDYFSVVGLPLSRIVRELKDFGVTPTSLF
ncbi:Maf family protein [Bacillus alkalicellulosilyticus]|uniref:Maf family protein n=1 Tax=Alkalihalobacterium alkalicellulosilyticum TaxID=1912214 RepID=UPI000996D6A8|nr:Maf family protein [Bacillus alkalicellulosilyticus]